LPESIRKKWRECDKVRKAHVLRTIFAEARRRHQGRASFHERLAEQKNFKDTKLTAWRLVQASGIFNEALRDIRSAVQVCCKEMIKPTEIKEPEPLSENLVSERWGMLRDRFSEGHFTEDSLWLLEDETEDAEDVWAGVLKELISGGTLL
jgi:hypothetical protein